MAGSYLGHGAKYWADRYYESQAQTHLPEASAYAELLEKYHVLENSCSSYQAKIADLRIEVEYLQNRKVLSYDPSSELLQGHTIEYWFNAYLRSDRALKDSSAQNAKLIAENNDLKDQQHADLYQGKSAKEWYEAFEKATSDYLQEQEQSNALSQRVKALSNLTLYEGQDPSFWHDGYVDLQGQFASFRKNSIFYAVVSVIVALALGFYVGAFGYSPQPMLSPSASQSQGGWTLEEIQKMREEVNRKKGYVWISTHGGTKYHCRSSCSGLEDPKQVPKDEALQRGFDACQKCY